MMTALMRVATAHCSPAMMEWTLLGSAVLPLSSTTRSALPTNYGVGNNLGEPALITLGPTC